MLHLQFMTLWQFLAVSYCKTTTNVWDFFFYQIKLNTRNKFIVELKTCFNV